MSGDDVDRVLASLGLTRADLPASAVADVTSHVTTPPPKPIPRDHPVVVVLDTAAMGQQYGPAELDALKLPPAQRRRLDDALAAIGGHLEGGYRQRARETAREARAMVRDLPAYQQDAGYQREPVTTTDPAELARNVPRY